MRRDQMWKQEDYIGFEVLIAVVMKGYNAV
jgi:hypothetical protein